VRVVSDFFSFFDETGRGSCHHLVDRVDGDVQQRRLQLRHNILHQEGLGGKTPKINAINDRQNMILFFFK
jgi:hypothetical protein